MKKMRVTTVLIIVSVGFAAIAAVVAESALQGQLHMIQAQEKTVPVVVANVPIPDHTMITPAMLKVATIPAGGVSPGALVSTRQVIGEISTQAMYPGEQILPWFLTKRMASSHFADKIPIGLVAISVLYNPVYTVGGKVQAGDRVAVIAVLNKGYNRTGLDASQMIAKNVLVLSVPAPPSPQSSNTQQQAQSISLAVTPQQADQIAFTTVYGQIYFVLEPNGSRLQNFPATVTDKTIG